MPFFSNPNANATLEGSSILLNEHNVTINYGVCDYIENYAAAPPANNNNTWTAFGVSLVGYSKFIFKNLIIEKNVELYQSAAPAHFAQAYNLIIPYVYLNFSLGLDGVVLAPANFLSAAIDIFIPPMNMTTAGQRKLIGYTLNIPLDMHINIQSYQHLQMIVNSRNDQNIAHNNNNILVYIYANSGLTALTRIYTYLQITLQGELY